MKDFNNHNNGFGIQLFWLVFVFHIIWGFNSIRDELDYFVSLSDYKVPFDFIYFPFYLSHILSDEYHMYLQDVIPYAMIPLILFDLNSNNNNDSSIKSISKNLVRLSFFVCYLLHMSWSIYPSFLYFLPWDCVLVEMLFWSSLVYPRPNKYGYYVLVYLLFRIMFGFGKFHFVGVWPWSEADYVKNLMIWASFPTTAALWLHENVPNIVWYGGHYFTIIAEIICPLLLIYYIFIKNCNPSKSFAIQFSLFNQIFLMVAIQITGNYGWFNTIFVLVCYGIYIFNNNGKVYNSNNDNNNNKKKFLFYLYCLLSVPFLLSCSMMTYNYLFNSGFLTSVSNFLPVYPTLVEAMQSHRLLHGFGAFQPTSLPPHRWVSRWYSYDCNVLDNMLDNNDVTCEWVKHRRTRYMPDDLTNDSLSRIPYPLTVSPRIFARYDAAYGAMWEGIGATDAPPSGVASMGINFWHREAYANYLCNVNNSTTTTTTNSKVTRKVKREVLSLGYKNGEFYYKHNATTSHIWSCFDSNDSNEIVPQVDKIIGIPEWDVRLPILLKKNYNIHIWNVSNLDYFDLAIGIGSAECLCHLHLLPNQWHPPYCNILYNLISYLNECKMNNTNYDEMEEWAKTLLGKKGKLFYTHELLFPYTQEQIDSFVNLKPINKDNIFGN